MVKDATITRAEIIGALQEALEVLPYTHAMWEAGAAAFGRVDVWSDIDLMIDIEDGEAEEVFQVIEEVVRSLSPIDLEYEVPQPSWHGHAQKFYRLENASPFLMLDIAVINHSNPNKFLESELHGNVRVLFDKSGVTKTAGFDHEDLGKRMRNRLEASKIRFEMFRFLPLKELNRGNAIEALAFYHAFVLRPLVEALRIRDGSPRFEFYTRYVHYDLPAEDVTRLEELYFVRSPKELAEKHRAAETWFWELVQEIEAGS